VATAAFHPPWCQLCYCCCCQQQTHTSVARDVCSLDARARWKLNVAVVLYKGFSLLLGPLSRSLGRRSAGATTWAHVDNSAALYQHPVTQNLLLYLYVSAVLVRVLILPSSVTWSLDWLFGQVWSIFGLMILWRNSADTLGTFMACTGRQRGRSTLEKSH
jgi:hypothetical protein